MNVPQSVETIGSSGADVSVSSFCNNKNEDNIYRLKKTEHVLQKRQT